MGNSAKAQRLRRVMAAAIACACLFIVLCVLAAWGSSSYPVYAFANEVYVAAPVSSRSAESVAAATRAAEQATASAADGDLVGAGSVPDTVHVRQFGAKGDGVTDDAAAIEAALESGATTVLFQKGASYKCDRSFDLTHGNVTILGNGATIFSDGGYSSSYMTANGPEPDEFFVSIHGALSSSKAERETAAESWETSSAFIRNINVYQLEFRAKSYDESNAVSPKYAYKALLEIHMAVDVDIWGCAFTIDAPGENQQVDGCNPLDLYSGWHNVTVENCSISALSDKENGGIWIRDQFNMGASHCDFVGNDATKISHDEILAVFNTAAARQDPGATKRFIEDVNIAENSFTVRENKASASVMNFTVTNGRNVAFTGNRIDTWACDGLLWVTDSQNVSFKRNEVEQMRTIPKTSSNFMMFRTVSGERIASIEDNDITLAAKSTDLLKKVYLFQAQSVANNKVTLNMDAEEVFQGGEARGNTVQVNASVHNLFNNVEKATGNDVIINAHVDNYLQWYNASFEADRTVSGNTFDNRVASDQHKVLMINEATMNGHAVVFTGNTLKDADAAGGTIVWAKVKDAQAQPEVARVTGNNISAIGRYGTYFAGTGNGALIQDNDGIVPDEGEGGAGEGGPGEGGAGEGGTGEGGTGEGGGSGGTGEGGGTGKPGGTGDAGEGGKPDGSGGAAAIPSDSRSLSGSGATAGASGGSSDAALSGGVNTQAKASSDDETASTVGEGSTSASAGEGARESRARTRARGDSQTDGAANQGARTASGSNGSDVNQGASQASPRSKADAASPGETADGAGRPRSDSGQEAAGEATSSNTPAGVHPALPVAVMVLMAAAAAFAALFFAKHANT